MNYRIFLPQQAASEQLKYEEKYSRTQSSKDIPFPDVADPCFPFSLTRKTLWTTGRKPWRLDAVVGAINQKKKVAQKNNTTPKVSPALPNSFTLQKRFPHPSWRILTPFQGKMCGAQFSGPTELSNCSVRHSCRTTVLRSPRSTPRTVLFELTWAHFPTRSR